MRSLAISGNRIVPSLAEISISSMVSFIPVTKGVRSHRPAGVVHLPGSTFASGVLFVMASISLIINKEPDETNAGPKVLVEYWPCLILDSSEIDGILYSSAYSAKAVMLFFLLAVMQIRLCSKDMVWAYQKNLSSAHEGALPANKS